MSEENSYLPVALDPERTVLVIVDMENDYRTMDSSYTESVWWAFKRLYDKGLIYKGFKYGKF